MAAGRRRAVRATIARLTHDTHTRQTQDYHLPTHLLPGKARAGHVSTADTVTVVAVKIVKPKSVAPSTPPRAAPRKKTAKARESPRVHRDAGGGGKVSGRRLSSSSTGSTLTDVSDRSTVRSQPTKSAPEALH